ncbi:hypothetical protein BH23GEM10_BH23GEM10_01480 [soil metagenome]
MLNRFSIRQVVMGAMALLALLALGGLLAMLFAASRTGSALGLEVEQLMEDQAIAERIVHHTQSQLAAARRYSDTGGGVHLDGFRVEGMAVYDEIRRYLFRDLGSEERRLVESLRERHESIEVAAQRLFSEPANGSFEQLAEVDLLNSQLDSLMGLRRASSLAMYEHQRREWQWLYAISAALVLAFLIALTAAAAFLRSRLIEPLAELSSAVRRVGAGDFDLRVEPLGNDELADVANSFNSMAERLHAARRDAAHAEGRFRDLVEGLSTVVWEADASTLTCTYISPRAELMFGYPVEQWTTTDIWRTLIHPDDYESVIRQCVEHTHAGVDHQLEYRAVRADGTLVWVRDFVRSVPDEGRQAGRLRGVITDVTDARAADEALRASEERYHSMFDRVPVALYRTTPDGQLLDGNAALLQLLGYPDVRQMLGINAADVYLAGDDRSRWRRMLDNAIGTVEVDRRHTRHDGSVIWVRDTARAVRDDVGATLYYEGALQDVTESVRAAEAVRRSEARFRSLIENASDGVLILSGDAVILYQSPAVERMLGHAPAETVGRVRFDLIHPDDGDALRAAYADLSARPGGARSIEFRYRHRDGEWRMLHAIGTNLLDDPAVGGFVINMIDTTVRHQLEQQLQHAQKMEAVGRLAGGIAHDFNNLLTAIQGYTDLLGDSHATDDRARQDLVEIRRAVDSAARLTRQLLAFSRRQVVRRRPTDVGAVVRELDQMLRRLITADIPLRAEAKADCWVSIDPGQLEQIVVNLVVNARDAAPKTGITVVVNTLHVEHGEDVDAPGLHAGEYVVLMVTDDGHGIGSDVLPYIFDPFFTTKDIGQGTGLGLATVYGIVGESGGRVYARSDDADGTVMRVFLPRVPRPAHSAESAASAVVPRTGTETILLVEDEAAVRSLAERVLTRHGYAVMSAANGVEALTLARNAPSSIDLLLTDVVMPGMGGVKLATQLLAEMPELQVLFISGYAPDAVPGTAEDGRTLHFLEKPFSPASLGEAVRTALDGRTALR